MKYNSKYDRYVDDDLVIYRWDDKKDKLVQCPIYYNTRYMVVKTKLGNRKVHRVLWETMIGEVPEGYELDHINAVRTDNRLENLRCVTHKENVNNPLTIKNHSIAAKRIGIPIETLKKAWEANKGRTPHNKGKKFVNGKYVNIDDVTNRIANYLIEMKQENEEKNVSKPQH